MAIRYPVEDDPKGRKVLSFTPDDSTKVCYFDCVYCPVGRTFIKTGSPLVLEDSESYKEALESILAKEECEDVEFVSLDPTGDPLIYKDLKDYCDIVHRCGKKMFINTTGCQLSDQDIRNGLMECDELRIEIQDTSQNMFRKLHRPASNLRFEDMIRGYRSIREWYKGWLNVAVFLVHRYNDNEEGVEFLKGLLEEMQPDEYSVTALDDPSLKGLCVPQEQAKRLLKLFDK